MKTKRLLWIIIAAVLLIAIILIGLPIFSQLYYHRSQAATLFAWQLGKEKYTTEEAFHEYLEEKQAENQADYEIPEDVELTVSVSEERPAGMQFFVLRSADGASSPQERVVVYFPGGSYTDQPRAVHWVFLNQLVESTGATVVVPIYPRLPDNNAETSYTALSAAYNEFMSGTECEELIFMGDSAGGGMALSFAMQLRDAGAEGPDKLILICPWMDVSLTNPDIPAYEKKDIALDSVQLRHLGVLWADELSLDDPVISPLFGSFDDLGRITIITGTAELLYPDIMLFHDDLSTEGVEHDLLAWEGMFHVFPLYVSYGIPEVEDAFQQICAAVQR